MSGKIFNFTGLSVIILRLLSSFSMFLSPFWGFIAYVTIDFFDSYILVDYLKLSKNQYDKIDKILDFTGYIVMLIISVQNPNFLLLFCFFLLRLIGQIVYMFNDKEIDFIIFPNFFEVMFLYFVLLKIPSINTHLFWFISIFIIVYIREIWLHYFVRWYIRKYGYPALIRKLGYYRKNLWD